MTLIEGSVGSALKAGADQLSQAGIEEAYREAVVLLAHRLKCPSALAYVKRDDPLPPEIVNLFHSDIERRSRREPSAHIRGERGFFGRDFIVNADTLVPRPETEQLVETVLEHLKDGMDVLDIGTGSGCIAVSLAADRPGIRVTAVDVSDAALAVARKNAEKHGVSAQIEFVSASLFDGFGQVGGRYFDIIASNPPYVSTLVLPTLAPELNFEPRMALDGGGDGLDIVRPLVSGACLFLRPGGRLFMEIGFDQGPRVAALMAESGFTQVEIIKDLDGHDRILSGVKSGSI